MTDLQAITHERYGNRYWHKTPNYLFAQNDTVAVLGIQEVPVAMLSMAIGFICQSEEYLPVAVQGVSANQNLFVALDGRWLAGYVPAVYRSHPFKLAQSQTGDYVLCIDETLVQIDDGPEGEAFFTDDGKPAPKTNDAFALLVNMEKSRNSTRAACAALQQFELFEPWPIKVQAEGEQQTLTGLHRINEAKLNSISADALLTLRNASALQVAYCQLLSMQHIQRLGKLASTHANVKKSSQAITEASGILQDHGTISFDNLR